MKFCVIGAGRMGSLHAANIAVSDRAELAYIVDSDKSRAETLAKRYGALAVTSTDEPLSNSDIKAVVIASATDTHADLIEASVKADKAIFCEKPIDLSLERVKACEHTINGFSLPVMIGFHRRFDETHKAVRQAIETGEIGFVESINIISRNSSPPSYDYIKTSGGQFLDQMIHDFDLALWMSGAGGKTKVFAMGAALFDPQIGELGDTDSAHVLLEFSTGAFCKIECSRRASYGYDQRVEIFGSLGMVSSGNLHNSAIEHWNSKGTAAKATLRPDFMQRYFLCYAVELDAFIDALEGATLAGADFSAGRRAQQLAEAACQSMISGQAILVELG